MGKLEATAFPDSQSNAAQYLFFLDGQNQLTNAEVWREKIPYSARLIGVGLSVDTQRSSGTLTIQIKKNGASISGAAAIINGTNPQYVRVATDEAIAENDVLTAEVTSVSFGPLANTGRFFIQTK